MHRNERERSSCVLDEVVAVWVKRTTTFLATDNALFVLWTVADPGFARGTLTLELGAKTHYLAILFPKTA